VIDEIRRCLDTSAFDDLFLGRLGWDRPRLANFEVTARDHTFSVTPVAQKCGLHVFVVETEDRVPAALQSIIDAEIAKRSPERLLLFSSPLGTVWRWPEARPSGGIRLVPHAYGAGLWNEDLVQRIARIKFTVEEQAGLSLLAVRERVRGSLNAEQVTSRFYNEFKTHHADLLAGIEGIEDEDDRSWYASLLMNRLMFVYFIQMKGFIGGDREFLRSCLAFVRDTWGPDAFYNFYSDLLTPLFHDGLGSHAHQFSDRDVAALLQHVPYVNGGIFETHEIEKRYSIRVRDEHFERIFDFFDSFTWHLDTRPTGNPNEINPDVLGYVFEQYINLTASGKKENGAYYTKQDVTGYMAASTIVSHLLQRLIDKIDVNPFVHLQASPHLFLHEDRLHGWDSASATWLPLPPEVETLHADATTWSDLSSVGTSAEVCLPGETWLDVIERREHTEHLVSAIDAGAIGSVGDLIVANVDVRAVLTASIRGLTSPDDVLAAWKITTSTKVLDPTCGSGAFLFAALDILDEVYAAILEIAELHVASGSNRAQDVLQEITSHRRQGQNLAYFRLKHASLNNLHGVDIMEEAVEIAKLRLFLTLAARLESPEEIEPLPDLDFNLKAGNLLVGFGDMDDARGRVATRLETLNAIVGIESEIRSLTEQRLRFIELLETAHDEDEAKALKDEILNATATLRDIADTACYEAEEPAVDFDSWRTASKPFHWFIEFPLADHQGGFDVVIGNPPYVARRKVDYVFGGFKTDDCPDIFASCMERSAKLCAKTGAFSMIVPIAFQFSSDYAAARAVMKSLVPWRCVSTYSRNPTALFPPGIGVRPVILVGLRAGDEEIFTTETRRWVDAYRPFLFHATRYAHVNVPTERGAWQRPGTERLSRLFDELVALPHSLGDSVRRGGHSIGFKQTALYYMSVFIDEPPSWTPEGELTPQTMVGALVVQSEEEQALAHLILAGRLAVWWWSSTGDDFHVTAAMLKSFPISLEHLTPVRERLLQLAADLREEQPRNPLVTLYNKKEMGNYDMLGCRHITDESDELILDAVGLGDYWPDVVASNHRLVRMTGERPGTRRAWPFSWEPSRSA
jgi:hypothetical protein